MKPQKFSIKKRLLSFKYAFNGIIILLTEEHNSRVHLLATLFAIIAGFIFKISPLEWIAVVIVIGLVFTLEIINSSIENIADFITLEKHSDIKKIKDLAAAAVLVGALTALIVGCIIFIPKILEFIIKA